MKKIGVITFSTGTENYGAVLQYLATQDFLKKNGFDPYLLRIKGERVSLWTRIFNKVKRELNRLLKSESNIDAETLQKIEIFRDMHKNDAINEKMHPRGFENFRKKNFKIIEDLVSNIDKYGMDAYCVGSDQVWTGDPYLFFLEFAPSEAKRFSIAPSTGHKPVTEDFVKRVAPALSKFDFITVREKSGLTLCQNAGRKDAHLVLDPTFLLTKKDYELYANQYYVAKKRPYIFLYLLGTKIDLDVESIFKFAEKNGCDVKYVASQGRFDDLPKIYPTINEWLSLISNADYVITNSFHGTAFAIINQIPFFTIPISGVLSSMNERIEILLDSFGLSNRIYKDRMQMLFEPVCWNVAETKISENKRLMTGLLDLI